MPFIIKAYRFGMQIGTVEKLCEALESLLLRHRLIGTRADITSRLKDVFEGFTEAEKDPQPIIQKIVMMKTTSDWWWAIGTTRH